AVTDFRRRADPADARAVASLRALFALAGPAVHEPRGRARRHARDGRNAVVDDPVAVVVEAVARLWLRIVRARVEASAADATADGGCRLLRFAGELPDAVRRAGEAARERRDSIVDDAVAVVVAPVADLRRGNAGRRAALVDSPVAVVVLPVAHLGQRT